MKLVGGVNVVVSEHAARRALARVPELEGCTMQAVNRWVEDTAGYAIRDRRMARRCPAWCSRDDEVGYRRRARASSESGHLRFVWDLEETATLLVRRKQEHDLRVWVVVTVVARVAGW